MSTEFLELKDNYINFANPFIAGLKNVYKNMVFTDIFDDDPVLVKEKGSSSFYSAIMALNGYFQTDDVITERFQGSMVISWELDPYLKTASRVLDEQYNKFVDEIDDVGMEIANITLGLAAEQLRKIGYKVEMCLPTYVVGNHHKVDSDNKVLSILVNFESDIGQIKLELNYLKVV